MRAASRAQRSQEKKIGLVPTMGYLHEGHLSLLRTARKRSDFLVMSLFVNPTQFAPNEDLDRYPRDEEGDLKKAEACGVDVVFKPEADTMYPTGFQTTIDVPELGKHLCGASRPGHFSGVATVVTKLLNVTLPDLAVFGEKDFQQLAIIRRLVQDLDLEVEIIGEPIIREEDGMAMSSRNAYLKPNERKQALGLSRGLGAAKLRFEQGAHDAVTLLGAAHAVIAASPLARIDYLALCDVDTLEAVDEVRRPAVLATAAHFGRTRLIDNIILRPS